MRLAQKRRRGTGQVRRYGTFLHTRKRGSDWLGREWNINVFKKNSADNPADAIGSFDEVVSGLAGLFAIEQICEDEGLCELTGAHEKPRAINIPAIFFSHDFSPLREFLVEQFPFPLCDEW
jgi:hypothetical protein